MGSYCGEVMESNYGEILNLFDPHKIIFYKSSPTNLLPPSKAMWTTTNYKLLNKDKSDFLFIRILI